MMLESRKQQAIVMLQEAKKRDEESEHITSIHSSKLLYQTYILYREIELKATKRML